MRILVVEDERDLNDVITKRLKLEQYAADSCYDGATELDCLSCAESVVILLDLMLPHVDGLEVLNALRSRGSKTPVLLLTARDSIEDRVLGLDAGADGRAG